MSLEDLFKNSRIPGDGNPAKPAPHGSDRTHRSSGQYGTSDATYGEQAENNTPEDPNASTAGAQTTAAPTKHPSSAGYRGKMPDCTPNHETELTPWKRPEATTDPKNAKVQTNTKPMTKEEQQAWELQQAKEDYEAKLAAWEKRAQ